MGALLVTLNWHWNFLQMHKNLQNSHWRSLECTTNIMVLTSHSGYPDDISIHHNLMTSICLEVMQGQVFFKCLLQEMCHNIAVDCWWWLTTKQNDCATIAPLRLDRISLHFHIWAWTSGAQKNIIPVVVVGPTKPALDQWSFGVIIYPLQVCSQPLLVVFCKKLTLTAGLKIAHWISIAVKLDGTSMQFVSSRTKIWEPNFHHAFKRRFSTIVTTVWATTHRFWGEFCNRQMWSWSCQGETSPHGVCT